MQFAGGANERSRKIDTAVTTRGQGQRCRASPCTYDGDGFQKRATVQEPKVAPFHAELKTQRQGEPRVSIARDSLLLTLLARCGR